MVLHMITLLLQNQRRCYHLPTFPQQQIPRTQASEAPQDILHLGAIYYIRNISINNDKGEALTAAAPMGT